MTRAWIAAHPAQTAILAIALLVRSANLLWGVPLTPDVGFYHGDEAKSWSSAANFPEVYLSSTNYLYGTAVQYAVGLLMLPVKVVLVYGLGWDEAFQFATIVVFRCVNVGLGTAAVALAYALGRRLQNERTGWMAAALLAVAFAPALHSALTTLDVSMSFLLTAAALQLVRAVESGSTRSYVVAGLLLGLLCGTKITGVLYSGAAIAWLAAVLVLFPSEATLSLADGSRRWKLVLIVAATTLGVFVVSTPHMFLGWPEFLKFMQGQKQQWYDKAVFSPARGGRPRRLRSAFRRPL